MAVQIGGAALLVEALGRAKHPGNIETHQLQIVDAVSGASLPGSLVTVDMSAPGLSDNAFAYAMLPSAITLAANTNYYIVSQETAGAGHDIFYDANTVIQTTAVAVVTSGVYFDTATSSYKPASTLNNSYGPVDFKYD